MPLWYPTLHSLQDAERNFDAIERRQPQLVTALPANPFDGQVIDYLADATNGVVWRFRYRAGSASAFKWEGVGGQQEIFTGQLGDMTNANNTATSLTGGPTQNIPLSGDWMLSIDITLVPASASIASAQIYVNGVASVFTGTSSPGQATFYRRARANSLTGGTSSEIRCSNANSVSTRYVNGRMGFAPVRVG